MFVDHFVKMSVHRVADFPRNFLFQKKNPHAKIITRTNTSYLYIDFDYELIDTNFNSRTTYYCSAILTSDFSCLAWFLKAKQNVIESKNKRVSI